MHQSLKDDSEITYWYQQYKEDFLRKTAQYPLSREQRLDIYQDAFIVLYEKLKYQDLTVKTNIKSYLLGIGKNMMMDKIKDEISERKLKEDLVSEVEMGSLGFYQMEPLSAHQEALHQALQKLSESCRKILILFYYRNYSIDAIMHHFSYRNENVTKSHKSRCLKKLREIISAKGSA